jgi:hypothetical protein
MLDARYWMLVVPAWLKRRCSRDTGYSILDAGNAGLAEATVRQGCSILDAGNAGVAVMAV